MSASIFFDFTLPNVATWFYFSLLLAIAVGFQFSRPLSLRNWDLVSLYFLVPGLLLLQEAHALRHVVPAGSDTIDPQAFARKANGLLLAGYICLISGSAYFFIRCLLDLGLDKRSYWTPNLNLAGLWWLTAALFVCMTVVAIRRMPDSPADLGSGPIALAKVQDGAAAVVSIQSGSADWTKADAQFWIARSAAVLLHLAAVVGLVMIGVRIFHDATTGVGMAGLYLMYPCTAYHISQVHHIWPVVFILWAIFSFRRPMLAGGLLGVAAGTTFFPFLLYPLWFGFYRGRGTGRFTIGFMATSIAALAVTALVLMLSGDLARYLDIALSLSDWQAWKAPRTESIWTGSHWAYRLPVFIAYMAFVGLTIFWPKPRNLAQVIAQTAGVIIGVQFWYANQGGVYVLWYLPLLLLTIFRPNLSEVRPPMIRTDEDWLARNVRRVMGRISGRTRSTELAA